MSKLNTAIRIPHEWDKQTLFKIFLDIDQQVNGLSEGRRVATYNAATSAPTTGTYAVGDFVKNSTPSELGSGGSKYVILGWICTDNDPLTFLQCRALTGN